MYVGHDSSVGIASRYGSDDPGMEAREGSYFLRPGGGDDYPPQSSARVKERVKLYTSSLPLGLHGLF